jgi:hypothetical protein
MMRAIHRLIRWLLEPVGKGIGAETPPRKGGRLF